MTFLDIPERQLRDASRLAIQSAFAATATFLVMQWGNLPEQFVGVLSGVLVVQPSVGNTIGEAWDRILATLVGCGIGIACLMLLPGGYGTAAALALAMFTMNAIAGFRPAWRYGVVAAVALALGSDTDVLQTAIDRSIGIGIGSIMGALTALLVWPDKGDRRARRHLREALEAIAKLIDTAVADVRCPDKEMDVEASEDFHERIADAREAADGVHFGDKSTLEDEIRYTDRLYNSVLVIRRVAEQSEDLTKVDSDLDELTEEIRVGFCETIRCIAGTDDELPTTDALDNLRAKVDEARKLVLGGDSADRMKLQRSALIFGFDQTLEQLSSLVRAAPGK